MPRHRKRRLRKTARTEDHRDIKENNDNVLAERETKRERLDDSLFTDIDCSFDSDNELPQPFVTKENFERHNFAVNDLIWAKYKRLYWPAVVLRVYDKKKKITVMFVDSPERENCICMSVSNVLPFDDKYKSLKKQKSSDPTSMKNLNQAIIYAEAYLCKRILNNNTVPACQYFRSPVSYCLPDDDTDCEKDGKVNNNHDDGSNVKLCEELVTPIISHDPELQQKCYQKLIELVQSPSCQTYLLDILNGTISCDRHNKFNSPSAKNRNSLIFYAGFGPIEEESQIDVISNFLRNLLKEHCLESWNNFTISMYVFDVWAPEALEWAIEKLCNVPKLKAQSLFRNNCELMKLFRSL